MSDPSDKALEAAAIRVRSFGAFEPEGKPPSFHDVATASQILDAAHDPKLGLDQSVCLRDVVDWMKSNDPAMRGLIAADVEAEFAP